MPLPNGAEEEFGDQRRLQLLDELERCIGLTLPPAACAFLWLADIGNLEDLVGSATRTSLSAELVRSYLLNFETQFRPLHKCRPSPSQAAMNPLAKIIHTGLQRGRKDSLVSSPASSRLSASPSLPSTPKLASKRKLDPLNTDMKQRSPIAKNFVSLMNLFINLNDRSSSPFVVSKQGHFQMYHFKRSRNRCCTYLSLRIERPPPVRSSGGGNTKYLG